MSLQTFSLFVPACFAINMAFGPNNVLSLSNGARDGVRMSVLASFGRLVAFAIMIAIAGLGLGALLLASQTLFTVIKFAGAAYLVWIGVKLIRSGPALVASNSADAKSDGAPGNSAGWRSRNSGSRRAIRRRFSCSRLFSRNSSTARPMR